MFHNSSAVFVESFKEWVKLKKFSKVIVGVVAGLVFVSGLSACGVEVSTSESEGNAEPSVKVVDGDADSYEYAVVTKEVEPGHSVTCVVYDSYKAGGLSCDWAGYHAEYDTPSDG